MYHESNCATKYTHKQLDAGLKVGCKNVGFHSTTTSLAGWSSSTQLLKTLVCFATFWGKLSNSSMKDGASRMEVLNNVIR